ncbi:MAG: amino acid aminotransferase [Pseudomonadota bacterium]
MFDVSPLPGDPILALMAAYRADASDKKVDLGVGVYQDDAGATPVLQAVTGAEQRILEAQRTKSYVGIAGLDAFNDGMTRMLLGDSHSALAAGRVTTVQTAGGSGGLRVAGELIASLRPDATIWVTTPTWANHQPLLSSTGLNLKPLRYYDSATGTLDGEGFLEDVRAIPERDVILLHGCCHNPTGADLDQSLWRQVAHICAERNILPFVDTAYQGFGRGLDADAEGVRMLAEQVPELLAVSSCSKNFGLYRERTGALTAITATASQAKAIRTHLMKITRSMISMPPDHGARIVATILTDQALRDTWLDELATMRERMAAQRRGFVSALEAHGLAERFAFVAEQSGMFSLLGIDKATIDKLREDWHVYIVGSSRVNVAGMTGSRVGYIAEALAATIAA